MSEHLTLVGYFPRNTAVPAGWTAAPITEICSVSACINSAPTGWIDHWLHNELGFFNSVADAKKVIPPDGAAFRIFAYRLLPAKFEHGTRGALPPVQLAVEPLSPDFASLGFDVVSKSISAFFECSPLSCNMMAREVPVNTYCLLGTLDEALAVAERFSREEPEPGPYYVFEVLRAAGPSGCATL